MPSFNIILQQPKTVVIRSEDKAVSQELAAKHGYQCIVLNPGEQLMIQSAQPGTELTLVYYEEQVKEGQ